jgi:hypothetical protein
VAGSKNITKRMPVSLAAILKIIEDVEDKFTNFSAFCAVAIMHYLLCSIFSPSYARFSRMSLLFLAVRRVLLFVTEKNGLNCKSDFEFYFFHPSHFYLRGSQF